MFGTWKKSKVAVKALYVNETESAKEAIEKEIRILKSLRYRYIIGFYGKTTYKGHLAIITEYAEQGSLKRVIELNLIKDWETKYRIALEIASGLTFIHSNDILHRDLKSDNVLLTNMLEVRLCDFGLAAIKDTISSSKGTLKGTIRWMAPELFHNPPKYSTKSDVYAYGMVLWEMAANCTTPFKGYDNTTVAVHISQGAVETLPSDTPNTYRNIVERCWRVPTDERPESETLMKELENEVQSIHPSVGSSSTCSFASSLTSSSSVSQSLLLPSSSAPAAPSKSRVATPLAYLNAAERSRSGSRDMETSKPPNFRKHLRTQSEQTQPHFQRPVTERDRRGQGLQHTDPKPLSPHHNDEIHDLVNAKRIAIRQDFGIERGENKTSTSSSTRALQKNLNLIGTADGVT
ncbi:hypothetical protein BGW41_007869 [Actinomortierella wolfii]|nr:hypothetical protein BGW41_007869 [Actinomortierella wolfii]